MAISLFSEHFNVATYERMTYTEMIRDDRLRNSDSSRFSSTVATPTAQLVTDTIDADAIMTEFFKACNQILASHEFIREQNFPPFPRSKTYCY
jgi:hypothetical protein